MHFAPIAQDAYDRASDKVALIERELDRAPERRGWDGSQDFGWVVPPPLLVGLIRSRSNVNPGLQEEIVGVDPLLGEIVGSWTEGGGFRRSRHGRILIGEPPVDPLGDGSDWSASGDVEVPESAGPGSFRHRLHRDKNGHRWVLEVPRRTFTIDAHTYLKDVDLMSMPDGSAVAVLLTGTGGLLYFDLYARVLLPLPALEVRGAFSIRVPGWDFPDWSDE